MPPRGGADIQSECPKDRGKGGQQDRVESTGIDGLSSGSDEAVELQDHIDRDREDEDQAEQRHEVAEEPKNDCAIYEKHQARIQFRERRHQQAAINTTSSPLPDQARMMPGIESPYLIICSPPLIISTSAIAGMKARA